MHSGSHRNNQYTHQTAIIPKLFQTIPSLFLNIHDSELYHKRNRPSNCNTKAPSNHTISFRDIWTQYRYPISLKQLNRSHNCSIPSIWLHVKLHKNLLSTAKHQYYNPVKNLNQKHPYCSLHQIISRIYSLRKLTKIPNFGRIMIKSTIFKLPKDKYPKIEIIKYSIV